MARRQSGFSFAAAASSAEVSCSPLQQTLAWVSHPDQPFISRLICKIIEFYIHQGFIYKATQDDPIASRASLHRSGVETEMELD
jgi:hypothetical protein